MVLSGSSIDAEIEDDRGKKSSGETSGTIGQGEISITKTDNGGPPYGLTLKK